MVSLEKSYKVVEAEGLSKVFKDFWMRTKANAVDNVTFDIRSHEIFGLLGPNGSGKSTIIKIILGLLHKSRGNISVFGKPPSDVSIKRRIGFLPEESYLYRFLNPQETLDYYGKLFGLDHKTRKRRVGELLDMLGLTHVAHRPIGEFSKGMTRRIGIAQALINDPDFLILDEPTSGLDPIGTRQVKDLIIEMGKRGKTVLLSSHLLGDVEDVCDRMVMLYGGKIRAQGTVDELLSDTQSTVIQTPRLAPETIVLIEQVIEKAEGKAIDSVKAPRQRLEEFFMELVEQARHEQVATSGVVHGGSTAEFLRAEEAEGGDLIESLVSDQEDAALVKQVEQIEDKQAKIQEEQRDEVLAELLSDNVPEPSSATPIRVEAPKPPQDVDASVIDSLLGDANADDSSEQVSKDDT
ncbi:MAG: ABC transporter ATP-binding protein [Planctomycetes bacterium]|nr:ABC transporter ATP-binding protein [Planctomycetota bacterium]